MRDIVQAFLGARAPVVVHVSPAGADPGVDGLNLLVEPVPPAEPPEPEGSGPEREERL